MSISSRLTNRLFAIKGALASKDVENARAYIANYWPKLLRNQPKDHDGLIGLPHPYLVPAFQQGTEFDFNEMYYWDTYFMVQGLLTPEHRELVVGMVANLLYMFKRFNIIPNASRAYLTGRSQPPLLSSLIWDVYDAFDLDKKWLKHAMSVAIAEYETVWMGTTKPHDRQVYKGLSRYFDVNYLHDLAESESGWDMTPRFSRHCLDFLPIDLNAMLYKYEIDFVRFYTLIDDTTEATFWQSAADKRAETVNKLMWSKLHGHYFDYNYARERRGSVSSMATFVPLWAGMASATQAKQLASSIKKYEHSGGLSATDAQAFNLFPASAVPTQWAYPNGWAPLHYFVVKGLQRYGYDKEAKALAVKWLKTNLSWFNAHGVFIEKYNVVSTDKPPTKGVYPSQSGFGWTNAIFERFCVEFIDK